MPAVGEVVVSPDNDPGGKNMVNKTLEKGDEVCVLAGGGSLPDQLFVFVESLDGGTAQRVVIDTTCNGDGLKLLDSFGALELVSFKNCVGQYDCFVDIMYTYLVTNKGNDELDVIQLNRTINDVPRDLLVGSGDKKLFPNEIFTVSETVEVEVCTNTEYANKVEVNGQSLGGCVCKDHDDDIIVITVSEPPSSAPSEPSSEPSVVPTGSTSPSFTPTLVPSHIDISSKPSGSVAPSDSPSFSLGPSIGSQLPTTVPSSSVDPSSVPR